MLELHDQAQGAPRVQVQRISVGSGNNLNVEEKWDCGCLTFWVGGQVR